MIYKPKRRLRKGEIRIAYPSGIRYYMPKNRKKWRKGRVYVPSVKAWVKEEWLTPEPKLTKYSEGVTSIRIVGGMDYVTPKHTGQHISLEINIFCVRDDDDDFDALLSEIDATIRMWFLEKFNIDIAKMGFNIGIEDYMPTTGAAGQHEVYVELNRSKYLQQELKSRIEFAL
jgi:hypothetical protein